MQAGDIATWFGAAASAVTVAGAVAAAGGRWVKRQQNEVRGELTARFDAAEAQLKTCLHNMSEQMEDLGQSMKSLDIEMKQIQVRSVEQFNQMQAQMNGSYLRAKEFERHAAHVADVMGILTNEMRDIRAHLMGGKK